LIDTSVWFLALRRQSDHLHADERRLVDEWQALIREGRAQLIGIVRQEVLSGIRQESDFERVRTRLSPFDDVVVETRDHEEAARFFNRCRARGVTGTPIDLLICAVAQRHDLAVFTTDRDFERYHRLLGTKLHVPRTAA
jgi:hypothetical protein